MMRRVRYFKDNLLFLLVLLLSVIFIAYWAPPPLTIVVVMIITYSLLPLIFQYNDLDRLTDIYKSENPIKGDKLEISDI